MATGFKPAGHFGFIQSYLSTFSTYSPFPNHFNYAFYNFFSTDLTGLL